MAEIAQTFALNPYAAEAQKLERQRKYAEILQAQGLQPEGKHSYAGIEAPPSAAGALAKGLQLGMSGFMQGRADRKYDDLIGRATAGRKSVMDKVVAALQGTEAVPEVPGSVAATEADVQDREMGMNMGTGAAPMTMGQQIPTQGGMGEGPNVGAPPQAAVPGSMEAANALMIGSEFPDLQAAGLGGMNSMALEAKKLKNAITLKAAPGGPNSPTGRPAANIQYYDQWRELADKYGEKDPRTLAFKSWADKAQQTINLGDRFAVVDPTNPATPKAELPINLKPSEEVPYITEAAAARESGTQAVKASGEAFKSLGTINVNIANIDDAIAAIDKGAETGAIYSMLPSVRVASVELDNVQKRMGLDIIGSVTFGALSQGELDLALNTALPTKLSPPDLRKWLSKKKAAQQKLSTYLSDAAIYLGKPGNTIAGWAEMKKPNGGAPAPAGGGEKPSEAEWNAMTPEERALWE